MILNEVIFREYDIRGVVNKDFDTEFAYKLGKALATKVFNTFNTQPVMTVGYDARHSSPELAQAITEGIQSVGGKVLSIGLVTSPMSYFTTFFYEQVNGAVMITGSHNPPEYNGFKMSVGKGTIHGSDILELKDMITNGNFHDGVKGSQENLDIFPEYISKYKKEFGSLEGIKVILDCGNGAGGCVAKDLYNSLGVDSKIIFEEPDGDFPNHHPDPTVEKNLVDLKSEVLKSGAHVGIGFDGDADRIGVVDDKGNMVFGDDLIALIGKHIVQKTDNKIVIGDVKCSDRMYKFLNDNGANSIMWKTGHSLIKGKIKDENAPFGGELSGHIFFADRNYGFDDALYAGLRLIEILAETKKSLSELLSEIPKGYNTPEIRIDTTEEKKHSIVKAIKQKFSEESNDYDVNLIDGIRISFKNGWALARASNTQPVLVLRFEADTPENLKVIQDQINKIVEPLL